MKTVLAFIGLCVYEAGLIYVILRWPVQFFVTLLLLTPLIWFLFKRWLHSLN